jgi:hypothetical protein
VGTRSATRPPALAIPPADGIFSARLIGVDAGPLPGSKTPRPTCPPSLLRRPPRRAHSRENISGRPAHGRAAHQPAAEVDAAGYAYRHHAAVAIGVAVFAGHHPVADLVVEGEGCFLPAAIAPAATGADLIALRRVDAMQADAGAADFDGVAIDDGSGTGNGNAVRCGRLHGEDYREAEEKRGNSYHSAF